MRKQLRDGRWVTLIPVADVSSEEQHLEQRVCGRCGARLRVRLQFLLARDRVDEIQLACPACGLLSTVFFLLG